MFARALGRKFYSQYQSIEVITSPDVMEQKRNNLSLQLRFMSYNMHKQLHTL